MDQQNSMRWAETLQREKNAKLKWQQKYLTVEEQQREQEAEDAMVSELSSAPASKKGHLTERDVMELRLASIDDEGPHKEPAPLPKYEVMRRKVAEEVARTRTRSHRFTGDLSADAMLRDIGPGLWVSINPSYAPKKLTSSSQSTHVYLKDGAWGERVRAPTLAQAFARLRDLCALSFDPMDRPAPASRRWIRPTT